MKSGAERQRGFRERMRKGGFVLRQVWVHPEDWPAVKRYAERKHRDRVYAGMGEWLKQRKVGK